MWVLLKWHPLGCGFSPASHSQLHLQAGAKQDNYTNAKLTNHGDLVSYILSPGGGRLRRAEEADGSQANFLMHQLQGDPVSSLLFKKSFIYLTV